MSELTSCNHCGLKFFKARAKLDNKKVTKLDGDFGLGGYDIFVHPKDVKIEKGNKEQRDSYFVSWMMEIGTFCEC